eukprot:910335-Pelagomonas_calceolata.AAC.2
MATELYLPTRAAYLKQKGACNQGALLLAVHQVKKDPEQQFAEHYASVQTDAVLLEAASDIVGSRPAMCRAVEVDAMPGVVIVAMCERVLMVQHHSSWIDVEMVLVHNQCGNGVGSQKLACHVSNIPIGSAIRVMQDQPAGHIFNMDGAGADGNATPRMAAYGASKRSLVSGPPTA